MFPNRRRQSTPLHRRMPAPWWAAAILALAWLLIPALADAQTAAPDFKIKRACAIKAWVGTRTKRTVYKLHSRRLGSSASIAEFPISDGLTVTISGVRGWWMLATAVHDARGKRLFKGKGWVWSRLLVQKIGRQTKLRKKPVPDGRALIDIPAETRVQLRGCRDDWSLVGWRHKRGWVAPGDQCPSPKRTGATPCRYSAR